MCNHENITQVEGMSSIGPQRGIQCEDCGSNLVSEPDPDWLP